jgi:GNAT superfamily N-acetyltransferase
MTHRFATTEDLDLLADWNHQLIRDEGHRNPMSVAELRQRMADWLKSEYRAVIFSILDIAVGYALFRENEDEIYLRQLFVARDRRRKGLGTSILEQLRSGIWPEGKRVTVIVLATNTDAVQFYRRAGFADYCVTLESRSRRSSVVSVGCGIRF